MLLNLSPGQKQAQPCDPRVVTFSRRESFEAEQFRRLRHRVEELAARRSVRVIAVTSPGAGEGKTITAVNLAGALAQARHTRVLLIDADLRRPRVGSACGVEDGRPGLVAALRQAPRDLDDVVWRLPEVSLEVLPCERTRVDPYEVLRSKAFADLLREARRRYSFVVVDTAPVIPVPDTSLLTDLIDGYLLVVSANATPRKLLGEALNTLEARTVLGLVFNRDPQPLFGYYGSYGRPYFGAASEVSVAEV